MRFVLFVSYLGLISSLYPEFFMFHSVSRLSLSGSHQVATGAESLQGLQFGHFSEFCPAAFPHNDFNAFAAAHTEESHHTQSLVIQIFTDLKEGIQRYNCPYSMGTNVAKESHMHFTRF